MDPRINEFAEQAKNNVPAGLSTTEWIAKYNEIFAELIVRECLTVIDDSKEYKTPQDGWNECDAGWNPALEQVEEDIKKHFGVDE